MDTFKTTFTLMISERIISEIDIRVSISAFIHQPVCIEAAILAPENPACAWVEIPPDHPLYKEIHLWLHQNQDDLMQQAYHAASLLRVMREKHLF